MPQQRHKSDNSPFNNPPYQRRQNSIFLADEQSGFELLDEAFLAIAWRPIMIIPLFQ